MIVAFDAITVCPGIIPMMATAMLDTIGREILSKERVCNEFLGVCAIPEFEKITVEDYSTRVLAEKPEIILTDDYITNLYNKIYSDPNPRATIKAVHISDPHIDLEYKVGSLAMCPGYLCCREEWGYPTNPAYQAGQFGAANCDLPVSTLANMLEHIATTVKPDLFFWTGDNTSHNDWNNTVEEVANATNLIT